MPPCIAPWATPGVGSVGLPRLHGGVADDEDLGVARDGQVRLDEDPSDAVRRRADGRRRPSARTRGGRTPAPHSTVRAGMRSSRPRRPPASTRHPVRVDGRDPGAGPDLDAEPLELALGRGRPVRRVGRQDPVHRLDEDDPGVARVDGPEVAPERVAGDLAERPGELDAGRPAADEDEGHPRPAPLGVGLALGGLEGDEDPPADLGRVLDGLEARRDGRPVVVAEVGVVGAGRDDERVVGDRAAVGQQDLALLRVEADGLAEDDRRVALLAQDRAQRLGDLARRQRAGRDLVEQRLEQVEVAPVDEGQPTSGSMPRLLGRVQPGEAAADDDDPVRRRSGGGGAGYVKPRPPRASTLAASSARSRRKTSSLILGEEPGWPRSWCRRRPVDGRGTRGRGRRSASG